MRERIPGAPALDDACRALRAVCKATGVDIVTVAVCHDGRVEIGGSKGPMWKWVERADIEPGSSLQMPSAALYDANDKNGAPDR